MHPQLSDAKVKHLTLMEKRDQAKEAERELNLNSQIHRDGAGNTETEIESAEQAAEPVGAEAGASNAAQSDSGDALYQYNDEGVPISKDPYVDSMPMQAAPRGLKGEEAVGFTGGTQEKKKPGTENAQKRSDTGTGL